MVLGITIKNIHKKTRTVFQKNWDYAAAKILQKYLLLRYLYPRLTNIRISTPKALCIISGKLAGSLSKQKANLNFHVPKSVICVAHAPTMTRLAGWLARRTGTVSCFGQVGLSARALHAVNVFHGFSLSKFAFNKRRQNKTVPLKLCIAFNRLDLKYILQFYVIIIYFYYLYLFF